MSDDGIDGWPEDPSECVHCGREREGHSHLHVYGDWGPEQDGFTRRPGVDPLCQDCWQERYNRVAGAYWEVEDADTLWNVLEASRGSLVANLVHLFVGSRPFVRVVDDELRGMKIQPYHDEADDVLRFTEERIDVDREWFDDLFAGERGSPYDTIAIIRPVEETPFGDVRERGSNSKKLGEYLG